MRCCAPGFRTPSASVGSGRSTCSPRFLGRSRAVRRLGSAALDLCYVAAGRFDGFWEQQLHPWDMAAGALIVEEAGGRVTGYDDQPHDLFGGQIVASNGPLHGPMLEVIRGARPDGGG